MICLIERKGNGFLKGSVVQMLQLPRDVGVVKGSPHFFSPHRAACGILVPRTGIEPRVLCSGSTDS